MIHSDWNKRVPESFPDESRVWVYQSNRSFSEDEEKAIREKLNEYVNHWMSHNRPVKGWAEILFNRFILLMADDGSDRLCGSAIDGSIRFIKSLEKEYNVELLNRMNIGFLRDRKILTFPMNEAEERIQQGYLDGDTLFFNNTVNTKEKLLKDWIQPIKESFLYR